MNLDLEVRLPKAHEEQRRFIYSPAKRKVIRAGRRGGKTVGAAILAVRAFLKGRRVLYATPTSDQIDRFWHECKKALAQPIDEGIFYKNETRHIIEFSGTSQRIRAKTAWNADSLRGDFADELILDEWQLMNEGAWEQVGAPMLLDNNGNATFVYTPPSPHSRSSSKATDPLHAAKLYKIAAKKQAAGDPRWEVFTFPSYANPHISREAIAEIAQDMTKMSFDMEIEARDLEDIPGALWSRKLLDETRVTRPPELFRIVVGVDPAASTGQTGIVVAGIGFASTGKHLDKSHAYTLGDETPHPGASPLEWAKAAVSAYYKWHADLIIGEVNNGGDMIGHTITTVEGGDRVNYKAIRATRGKYTRAEPVAALYEQGRAHHVGVYEELEDELCTYVPGNISPNRLDAKVWAITELMFEEQEPEEQAIVVSFDDEILISPY